MNRQNREDTKADPFVFLMKNGSQGVQERIESIIESFKSRKSLNLSTMLRRHIGVFVDERRTKVVEMLKSFKEDEPQLAERINKLEIELVDVNEYVLELFDSLKRLLPYQITTAYDIEKQQLVKWFHSLEPRNRDEWLRIMTKPQKTIDGFVKFMNDMFDRDAFDKDVQIEKLSKEIFQRSRQYDIVYFIYERYFKIIKKIRSDPIYADSIPDSVKLYVNLDNRVGYVYGTEGTSIQRPLSEFLIKEASYDEPTYKLREEPHEDKTEINKIFEDINNGLNKYKNYVHGTAGRKKIFEILKLMTNALHNAKPESDKYADVVIDYLKMVITLSQMINALLEHVGFHSFLGKVELRNVNASVIEHKIISYIMGVFGQKRNNLKSEQKVGLATTEETHKTFMTGLSAVEVKFPKRKTPRYNNEDEEMEHLAIFNRKKDETKREIIENWDIEEKLANYVMTMKKLTGRSAETTGFLAFDWLMEFLRIHSKRTDDGITEIENLKRKNNDLISETRKLDISYRLIHAQIEGSYEHVKVLIKEENSSKEYVERQYNISDRMARFNGLVKSVPEFSTGLVTFQVAEKAGDPALYTPASGLAALRADLVAPNPKQYDYGTKGYANRYNYGLDEVTASRGRADRRDSSFRQKEGEGEEDDDDDDHYEEENDERKSKKSIKTYPVPENDYDISLNIIRSTEFMESEPKIIVINCYATFAQLGERVIDAYGMNISTNKMFILSREDDASTDIEKIRLNNDARFLYQSQYIKDPNILVLIEN